MNKLSFKAEVIVEFLKREIYNKYICVIEWLKIENYMHVMNDYKWDFLTITDLF
jgi:hypothetical protein